MKVNMSLLGDGDAPLVETGSEESPNDGANKDRRSGIKIFMAAGAIVTGLGLFVWSMTSFVNNMRLNDQGHASSVVYDMQNLASFSGDGLEGSAATSMDEEEPPAGDGENPSGSEEAQEEETGSDISQADYTNDSEEVAALRQEAKAARDEAALAKQELKNAEDMLDASLTREEELKRQLDGLTGDN